MFTGIIEEIGEVVSIASGSQLKDLTIRASASKEGTTIGQSISVNGVCLTAIEILNDGFKVQAGLETLKTTNLGELKAGSRIHLERAIQMGSRLDGHIVQGHVDGTCELVKKVTQGRNMELTVSYPGDLGIYFIRKGSVALDGVSLTIHSIDRKSNRLSISLIPQTVKSTLFSEYREGKILNIEVDLIGKYIHNFISEMINNDDQEKTADSLSKKFLAKQGYL